MMRVLYAHQEIGDPYSGKAKVGGAEVILYELMLAMQDAGHETRLAQKPEDFLTDLDAYRPDLVHFITTHYYWGMEPMQETRRRGIPACCTLMDYWPFCGWRMLLDRQMRGCAAVTGDCNAPACGFERAPSEYRTALAGLHTIAMNAHSAAIFERNGIRIDSICEPGVDAQAFRPAEARDGFRVVTSAAWAQMPWKGMEVLREAISHTPWPVMLLHGLPRARLPEVLGRAQVYVFPSLYEETFGMALCEAMACGCACIASDVAGARAQITDGVDGLLVPPGDARALQCAIERLMAEPMTLERLGTAARQKVLSQFTRAHMRDRYLAVYQSLRRASCAV